MCTKPLYAYARQQAGFGSKRDVVFTNSVIGHQAPFIERNGQIYSEKLLIPCGQCMDCRLEYSRQWANRCVLETIYHEHNYFLTLTIDDEHLFSRNFILPTMDLDTGECFSCVNPSLLPGDLSVFFKQLRSKLKYDANVDGIRFYACGEYGSDLHTRRPHYHSIVFNLPIPDLVPYRKNHAGDWIFSSEYLDSIWKQGKVFVGYVTWKSCAYVARYMTKKLKGKAASEYAALGVKPEFCRMSRNPGIGREYFERNSKKMYLYDEIVLPLEDDMKIIKPPKYYDRLYDNIDPIDLSSVKNIRAKASEIARAQELFGTDLSEVKYYELKDSLIKERSDRLLRLL